MDVKIEPSWKEALKEESTKPYFKGLTDFVRDEYKSTTIYPPPKFLFHAFELTPFDKVKVVILGQDPYHGLGQAHGLCFSVPEGIAVPPSLQNIYKEIADDLEQSENEKPCFPMHQDARLPSAVFGQSGNLQLRSSTPKSGNLERWAEQGVLLLNATLTVRAHQAGSHQRKGWETFTDAIIKTLSDKKQHVVFLLWGRYAKEKGATIDFTKHCVLEAAHPSPFSAYHGFFGCKHFSKTNAYLSKHGQMPIVW